MRRRRRSLCLGLVGALVGSAVLGTAGRIDADAPGSIDAPTAGVPAAFRPVGPARLADTREADCGCTRVDAHTIRVQISRRVGPGAEPTVAALTVTTTGAAADGYVTAFPAGRPLPETSTVNLRAGVAVSN